MERFNFYKNEHNYDWDSVESIPYYVKDGNKFAWLCGEEVYSSLNIPGECRHITITLSEEKISPNSFLIQIDQYTCRVILNGKDSIDINVSEYLHIETKFGSRCYVTVEQH